MRAVPSLDGDRDVDIGGSSAGGGRNGGPLRFGGDRTGLDSALNLFGLGRRMPEWKLPGVSPPEPGHAIRVDAGGTPVAVFNLGTRLVAVAARCTHVGGPLDRGAISGNVVTCPLHGSQFDLTTGKAVRGPATEPVRSYRVRGESGALVLETD